MELARSFLFQRRIQMNDSINEQEEIYNRVQRETKNRKLHSLFQDKERRKYSLNTLFLTPGKSHFYNTNYRNSEITPREMKTYPRNLNLYNG